MELRWTSSATPLSLPLAQERCFLRPFGGCFHWSRSRVFCYRRTGLDCLGYRQFLLVRSHCDNWSHLQVRCFDGECGNRLIRSYGQLNSALLRINEFLTEVVAGIKPSLEGFRVIARPLFELNHGFAGRLEPVIVDREDRGDDLSAIRIEDLDDVTIRKRIQPLKV